MDFSVNQEYEPRVHERPFLVDGSTWEELDLRYPEIMHPVLDEEGNHRKGAYTVERDCVNLPSNGRSQNGPEGEPEFFGYQEFSPQELRDQFLQAVSPYFEQAGLIAEERDTYAGSTVNIDDGPGIAYTAADEIIAANPEVKKDDVFAVAAWVLRAFSESYVSSRIAHGDRPDNSPLLQPTVAEHLNLQVDDNHEFCHAEDGFGNVANWQAENYLESMQPLLSGMNLTEISMRDLKAHLRNAVLHGWNSAAGEHDYDCYVY
jgi:hypothetical protein